jgi:uncharacterized Zn finger protein
MVKSFNEEFVKGVFRTRACETCDKETQQEILFENNSLMSFCLECGSEVVLTKEDTDG